MTSIEKQACGNCWHFARFGDGNPKTFRKTAGVCTAPRPDLSDEPNREVSLGHGSDCHMWRALPTTPEGDT